MSQNNDFFKQNERFSRLIEYYAFKSGNPDTAMDLWTCLWILKATTLVPLNDRYISVCIRNRFIDLMRQEKKHAFSTLEKDLTAPDVDIDAKIDLENVLGKLKDQERDLIYEHFYEGKTYNEISKREGISRQATCEKARRILKKMKGFFGGT